VSFPRYPQYKNSGVPWISDMPHEWTRTYLKHVAHINMGQSPASKDCNADGIGTPFLQGNGEFDTTYPSAKQYCPVARKLADRGDILFSVRAPVGALNLADRVYGIGRGLCAIKSLEGISKGFLRWFLSSSQSFLDSVSTGSTFEAVSAEQIENMVLALPPTEQEQTQITRFLDLETARIDALIEQQQRLMELLKEKRQAVISHAVTKGLDPTVPMRDSGVEWLGEVPVLWDVMPSKYIFDFVTSGSRGWAEFYSDEGDLFFRITNLTRDSIEPKLESIQYVMPPSNSEGERSRIRLGDILISITADLGSVCVADQSIESGYVSQHIALARPNFNLCASRWIGYLVLSTPTKEQLVGAGYGGTKVQLNLDDIKTFFLAVPSLDEQKKIVRFLDAEIEKFDSLIYEATRGVSLLAERRSALISAAVTGKIDVRNWQPPAPESEQEAQQELAHG